MRYNIISALATATLVVFASCSKENPVPAETTAASNRFEVTIRGEMTDFASDTKASAVSGMRMQWTDGDAVWAYGTVDSELSLLGKLTVTIENDNNYVAVMNGTLSSAPAGGRLYLVHSSLNTAAQPGLSGNVLTVDLSDQPSDIIPFVAYATVDGVTESAAAGLKAVFSFATSVLKVNIRNLAADAVLTSASVSNIETNCTLTLDTSEGTFGIGNDGTVGTVNKALSGTASQGKTCFYVSVPCFAASTKRVLTITANGKPFYTYNVFPDARTANKYVNYVYKAGKGPEGAIIAPFTVSSGTEVFFSRGNLYYDSSSGSLKFEANQYSSTPLSEGTYNASHVSHFRWAWKTSSLANDIALAIGTGKVPQSECDTFFTNSSWTTPREDLTVEGTTGIWRTLSCDEWDYLLNTRKVIVNGDSKTPYGEGNVEGMNGLILLPNDWDGSVYDGSGNSFTYGASAFSNTFTESTNPAWSAMEEAGCVFLPAAGRRATNSIVYGPLSSGYYWSSTTDSVIRAYDINFFSSLIYSNAGNKDDMDYGFSVRLVCARQ